jgi:hypothetical protein
VHTSRVDRESPPVGLDELVHSAHATAARRDGDGVLTLDNGRGLRGAIAIAIARPARGQPSLSPPRRSGHGPSAA